MKKTWIALILVLAMCAGLMTGCGGSGKENEGGSGDTTTAAADNSLQKVLDAGKFVLGLDATFKPMGFTDENDQVVGFDIDVAKEVCKRMGVELVTKGIDWDTKEKTLNAGTVDCIWNGMSIDDSRKKAMNLSDPYMKNIMVFTVKGDSKVQSKDELAGKRIAVQSGSTAQTILQGSGLQYEEVALSTNVEALQQLDLGMADAVFLDSVVINYEIKSGKDYKVLDDNLYEEEYAIGFRKGDQKLRDKVQEILSAMKKDGTLGKISTEWFGSDVTTVQ